MNWLAMPRAAMDTAARRQGRDGARALLILAFVTAISGPLMPSAGAAGMAPADQQCFAETGQCVQGRFLEYWQQHGGLAINGYPLAPERREYLEDGKEYTVQYFERVRLELHPENAPPYDVLLGQFGRRLLPSPPSPIGPQPGMVYFPETGRNVSPEFFAYWQANGGLAQFGYPLAEATYKILDGVRYDEQYFERGRLESHPENADPRYRILLGQFGRQILAENDLLGVARGEGMGRLYISDPEFRRLLGTPEPATVGPGAYLPFERGAMLWRGDARRIYVLCDDQPSRGPLPTGGMVRGDDDRQRPIKSFPDTWAAGQEPGGGPAPVAGRFLPAAGFGKVWREHQQVRDCLGYATAAAETAYTQRYQPFFTTGAMLSLDIPAGRFIYAVSDSTIFAPSSCGLGNQDNPGCRSRYTRYPDPAR